MKVTRTTDRCSRELATAWARAETILRERPEQDPLRALCRCGLCPLVLIRAGGGGDRLKPDARK